jgi:hypothetical protein
MSYIKRFVGYGILWTLRSWSWLHATIPNKHKVGRRLCYSSALNVIQILLAVPESVHHTTLHSFWDSNSKAVPVTDRGGPYGCHKSRIPHSLDKRLTGGDEVVALTRRPRSTPQKHFPALIYVRGRVNPTAVVRLEGLDKLKKMQTPHRVSNP